LGCAVSAASLSLLAAGVARAEPVRTLPAASPPAAAGAADAYAADAFMIIHLGKHLDVIDEKGSSWRPVRGLVYRIALTPPEFLEAVGRPDLAGHERSRHRTARTLSIVGDIVAPIGLFATLLGLGVSGGKGALVGLGAIVGGVVMHEVGESMLNPSLPESEALRLADAYNNALRARLGLPPLDAPQMPSPKKEVRTLAFGFAALPSPNGGVAVLGARF